MSEITYPKYSKEQLTMFDGIPAGVLVLTDNGKSSFEYAYSNPFLAQSLDYTFEEVEKLLKEDVFALIYEADRQKTQVAREEVMLGETVDSISRQKKKDGSFVWILAHLRRVDVDGKFGLFFLFSRIQELIGLQNELSERNEVWSNILKSVPIGLLVFKVKQGITTTLSINQGLVDLANYVGSQLDDRVRNWTEAELAMIFNQDIYAFCENEDIPIVKEMLEQSEKNENTECIFRLRGSGMGKTIYLFAKCVSKETDEGERTYYVTYQDVTEIENRRIELIEKQELLYKLSYYDALTGVKNRNAYNEYVHTCRTNRIYNVGFAFCDINGLKQTNDSLGHYYGDRMICKFVSILREFFDNDMIYRLSGDEFVVVCPGIEREEFLQMMGTLTEHVQAEDNLASVGFIWKYSVSDVQRRTTQAEQIMYVEKQRYYETTRTVSSKHRPRFLERLLKEFEEGRFIMYLQPKTTIDGSTVMGAEALSRKINSAGNIIPPYEYVPQLEHERLIPKLDFFMLEQACAFLQEQHFSGNDQFSISVNISRVTIVENEFMQTVESILAKYDFDRSNLELELTESNKTLDSLRLEEYLIELKALGVQISIDDMGTDYSSLTLLLLEGVNWVKLDRSLIVRLRQEKAKALLINIIRMCHEMNLKVIAEGVETEEDRKLLEEMQCDAYQGYLKSKPIPVQEFKERFL